jgi:hypothetical protein
MGTDLGEIWRHTNRIAFSKATNDHSLFLRQAKTPGVESHEPGLKAPPKELVPLAASVNVPIPTYRWAAESVYTGLRQERCRLCLGSG